MKLHVTWSCGNTFKDFLLYLLIINSTSEIYVLEKNLSNSSSEVQIYSKLLVHDFWNKSIQYTNTNVYVDPVNQERTKTLRWSSKRRWNLRRFFQRKCGIPLEKLDNCWNPCFCPEPNRFMFIVKFFRHHFMVFPAVFRYALVICANLCCQLKFAINNQFTKFRFSSFLSS